MPERILVVDDHPEMTRLIADGLGDAGYEPIVASGGADALELARADLPDLVITDLRMRHIDGFDVLAGIKALDPSIPVLIMTAFGAVETAVEAMRRGAWTYVTKPFRLDELLLQVARAVDDGRMRRENGALKRMVRRSTDPDGIVGASPEMQAVYERIARLSDADVPVLVRGESGSGKELVARALHYGGPRGERPYVAVNCAALPATLLESELFGHVRGSFTGAAGARRGLFVEADGGTLFLDEIGDMPLELQGHLLRVLEDGRVRPVGSDTARRVDVRIVAATHQPLEERVAQGRFRADLFYRLDVVPITVPPLRDRSGDLPLLVEHLISGKRALRRLSVDALSVLEQYPWPGNVRELENLLRRLELLVDHEVADVPDLERLAPHIVATRADAPFGRGRSELVSLRQMQDAYIQHVVERCDGNKTRAAEILGIDVSTIHRRARVLG